MKFKNVFIRDKKTDGVEQTAIAKLLRRNPGLQPRLAEAMAES